MRLIVSAYWEAAGLEVGADANEIAAGVFHVEFAHAPGLIDEFADRQTCGLPPGMHGGNIGLVDVTRGTISSGIKRRVRGEVEQFAISVHERVAIVVVAVQKAIASAMSRTGKIGVALPKGVEPSNCPASQ
jgi:hypothetical protein